MLYPTEFKDVLRRWLEVVSGEAHLRHRRVSIQRSARRRGAVLDRRSQHANRAGRRARGDDCRPRDHRAAGDDDRPRLPPRQRSVAVPMTVDTALRSTEQPDPAHAPRLRRVLSFRDLLLFYIVTGFSLRWIATAAAAGPSALVIWVDRGARPLRAARVHACSSCRRAIPKKAASTSGASARSARSPAFITGWTYWGSNLPYLPGLLYFAAANALFVGGPAWQALVVQQHLLHRRRR